MNTISMSLFGPKSTSAIDSSLLTLRRNVYEWHGTVYIILNLPVSFFEPQTKSQAVGTY